MLPGPRSVLADVDVYFIPRVRHVHFVTPRAPWNLTHRALPRLAAHSCGQTGPLDPLSPRNTFTDPPGTICGRSHWVLTRRPRPFLSGPPVPAFHPELPTLASSPPCPAPFPSSCPAPCCPPAPLRASGPQGRGRTGLAFLLFVKAAGLWPLAHAGRECRNRPF